MSYIDDITTFIASQESQMLQRYSQITGRDATIESFNGTFGGKNKVFLKNDISTYQSFEAYLVDWLESPIADFNNRSYDGSLQGSSAERIINCLKDDQLRDFIFAFLARTFAKKTGYAAPNFAQPPYPTSVNNMVSVIKAF